MHRITGGIIAVLFLIGALISCNEGRDIKFTDEIVIYNFYPRTIWKGDRVLIYKYLLIETMDPDILKIKNAAKLYIDSAKNFLPKPDTVMVVNIYLADKYLNHTTIMEYGGISKYLKNEILRMHYENGKLDHIEDKKNNNTWEHNLNFMDKKANNTTRYHIQ